MTSKATTTQWPAGAGMPWACFELRASRELRLVTYVLGAFIAACIPGLVLLGPSPDLENYRILYEEWNFADIPELLEGNDPAYFLLSKVVHDLGASFQTFLFLLALLTCSIQALLLARLDTHRTMLLVLYASYLFWLHDYTQIRFSLALALVLLGIYQVRGRWLLFLLGAGVHASVALIVVLHVLWRNPRFALILLSLGVPALVASGKLDAIIVSLALRIATYVDQRDVGVFDDINLFSLMPLTQAVITLLCMRSTSAPGHWARQEIYFAWVGLASFYVFSFLPVLAFRFYEMMIPFFLILVSRNWSRSRLLQGLTLLYILLGLRVSFLSADALLPLL